MDSESVSVVITVIHDSMLFCRSFSIWIFQKSSIKFGLWYNRGRRTAGLLHTGCNNRNSTVSPIWIFQKSSTETGVWYNRDDVPHISQPSSHWTIQVGCFLWGTHIRHPTLHYHINFEHLVFNQMLFFVALKVLILHLSDFVPTKFVDTNECPYISYYIKTPTAPHRGRKEYAYDCLAYPSIRPQPERSAY